MSVELVMKYTPILFLDLDGTVRYSSAGQDKFINSAQEVEIFDGVLDILKSHKEKGWRIVAISNQGGIATGHIEEHTVGRIMEETNRMCARLFDRVLWCPHHPDAVKLDEANNCLCRKPRIGNVVAAMLSMGQQFGESYAPHACVFVGDRPEDEECAKAANIPFIWAGAWRERGPLG